MLVPHHIDSSISLKPLYKGKKNISMDVSVTHRSLRKESTAYLGKYSLTCNTQHCIK